MSKQAKKARTIFIEREGWLHVHEFQIHSQGEAKSRLLRGARLGIKLECTSAS
jgi:hypothetical protein